MGGKSHYFNFQVYRKDNDACKHRRTGPIQDRKTILVAKLTRTQV